MTDGLAQLGCQWCLTHNTVDTVQTAKGLISCSVPCSLYVTKMSRAYILEMELILNF